MSSTSSFIGRVSVTEVPSGFGKAITQYFTVYQWYVIRTERCLERLNQLKADLGEAFIPLCFDTSKRIDVQKALKTIDFKTSPLDILISDTRLTLSIGEADEVD